MTPERPHERTRQQGISLEKLTQAFAEAMGVESAAGPAPPDATSQTPAAETAESQADKTPECGQSERGVEDVENDVCPVSPATILEALLFVGDRDNRPLSATRAAELMRGVGAEEIPELVRQLDDRYSANGCPYRVDGDASGYRLVLRNAFHPLRNRFYDRVREARLSQAAIEVLSIVAYEQPLTAERINGLRGKPSNHLLAQLVRRGLLRIERQQAGRRTARYLTTNRFLKVFGMETLDDLPRSEELDSH